MTDRACEHVLGFLSDCTAEDCPVRAGAPNCPYDILWGVGKSSTSSGSVASSKSSPSP